MSSGYPEKLPTKGAAGEVEVRVGRLTGDTLFHGCMRCDQTIGSLLERLKVPTDSLLMVGDAPANTTSLVGDFVGDDGRVAAILVTTGLELEHRFHCRAFEVDKHTEDKPVRKGKGKGKHSEEKSEVAGIFLPSGVGDPVASINKAMSEKLAVDCCIDTTRLGYDDDVSMSSLSLMDDLRLLVEGREALQLQMEEETIAPALLLQELTVEYGESNPTRCYTSAKLLQKEVGYFVASESGGKSVFEDGGPGASESTRAKLPLWRPHRSRWAVGRAKLDDGRVLETGGEYEDYYDPMFCIFNDILVKYPDGRVPELYTYPRHQFPPTDSHACVQVGGHLYLLGNAGYPQDRKEHMQVLIVDLENYSVKQPDTYGKGPAWCSIDQMSPGKSISTWRLGAAGCHPEWRPPENLHMKMEFAFNNDRAEGYVSGLFFGIVVRLEQFSQHFQPKAFGDPSATRDTYWVSKDEIPQRAAVLRASDFTVESDAGYTRWIIAKVNETLAVVYQSAHNVEIGMVLHLDRDHRSSDGVHNFCGPPDMHVRRADGSFYGLLRARHSGDKYTGLQCAIQTIPEEDSLDEVTSKTPPRVVDSHNVEEITEWNACLDMCAYRPLSLFLAEVAAKQVEAAAETDPKVMHVAHDHLTQVVDRILFLAPMENELSDAMCSTGLGEASNPKQAVLEKWCVGEVSNPNPNPTLEGRDIVVKIYPGPACWHLNVDTLEWFEA